MKETVTFVIGGEPVDVPPLTWDILEDIVLPLLDDAKARQDANVQMPWYKVRGNDVRILAAAMRKPLDEVRSRLIGLDEAAQVSIRMVDLLRISGFTVPGEMEAASGSMETSTSSSPDLSPEGSLA